MALSTRASLPRAGAPPRPRAAGPSSRGRGSGSPRRIGPDAAGGRILPRPAARACMLQSCTVRRTFDTFMRHHGAASLPLRAELLSCSSCAASWRPSAEERAVRA